MIRRPPRSTLLTHSFPTRRSSDLIGGRNGLNFPELWPELWNVTRPLRRPDPTRDDARRPWRFTTPKPPSASVCEPYSRSEEHTSELQSLMRISYAVFCLKKKKTTKQQHDTHIQLKTAQI